MNTTTSSSCSTWLLALAGLTLFLSTAQAATVGYWRFEDSPGFLSDSSVNNLNLTGVGTGGGPLQTDFPYLGVGTHFPTSIPTEGVSTNDSMANFGSARDRNFTIGGNNPLFDTAAFTIEALVHQTARTDSSYIASHWRSTGGGRSWALGVNSSGLMYMVLSTTGSDAAVYNSSYTLSLDNDYYVGASYSGGDLSFHIQDLDGGSLMSETFDLGIIMYPSSTADFQIGTYNNSDSARRWQGFLDEVRLSDTELSTSELLIAIPEASTLSLLVLAGGALLFGMRGRARTR